MAIQYYDPIQTFRFLIEVEDLRQDDNTKISGAFATFSGINMTVETLQSRAGDDRRGVQEYIPVLTRYDPVTLSKGVVGDNDFLNWLLSVSADLESGPTGKILRRDIRVITRNDMGEDAVVWTLKGAMPIGYQITPLDSSRTEVLMESVTFAITGVRRTTHENSRVKRQVAPPG